MGGKMRPNRGGDKAGTGAATARTIGWGLRQRWRRRTASPCQAEEPFYGPQPWMCKRRFASRRCSHHLWGPSPSDEKRTFVPSLAESR